MSAFSKAWSFLKSQNWDRYDEEYAMFGGTEGLRDQHRAYLDAYHGGRATYAGIELPGEFLGDEDEEPPMTFDEFAQTEVENMKRFRDQYENSRLSEAFPFDVYYSELLDSGSNY